LYEEPERPPNAVDYIKRYMGAPTGVDVDAMRSELESLKAENGQLKQTVADLKEKQDA
jgi:cell division protein FtsB